LKVEIDKSKKIYVESDSYGYSIIKYGTRITEKDGEKVEVVTTQNLGNFHTIKGCLKHIALNIKVKESTATTLGELLKEVKEIEKYIEEKVNI
jgi:hypothetical protein